MLGKGIGVKVGSQLGIVVWKILNARLRSWFLFGLEHGSANLAIEGQIVNVLACMEHVISITIIIFNSAVAV